MCSLRRDKEPYKDHLMQINLEISNQIVNLFKIDYKFYNLFSICNRTTYT